MHRYSRVVQGACMHVANNKAHMKEHEALVGASHAITQESTLYAFHARTSTEVGITGRFQSYR